MQNELIAACSRPENITEIPSYQTLKAGVYWRARVDVSIGTDTVRMDGKWQEQEIFIPAGQVHLLLNLHFVDDDIHSVTLHHHPGDKRQNHHKFLVKDFLDQFDPAYDAEVVRQRELAEVQQEVLDIQNDLAAGPEEEVIISALLEEKVLDEAVGLPDQQLSDSTSVGALITQSGTRELQLEKIQRQIRNQQAIVQRKADWMTDKSRQLSATIQKMTPYFAEKSAAALASCQESLNQHDKILKAVTNLELYTLKGVEIQQLCAGDSAAPEEPIHVFQRKLFLDEETLIHHKYGGADYRSLSAFAKEMDSNESLQNRLIPCQRGVVTIQWRRQAKHYSDNAFENAHENMNNFIGFLLVRDGGNFYMVFSKLVTEHISRTFPTKEEMDITFKGWKGDITFKDIEFANARERHDNLALHYKRVLLLLWGLQDDRKLFGTLKMEEQQGQLNWFSYQVQTELLHLVHDDEWSTLIGEQRPSIRQYIKEKNSLLQSGSRVITSNSIVISESPEVVRCRANAVDNSGIYIAYRSGNDIMVDVPATHYVWSRNSRNTNRTFNASCNLSKLRRDSESFPGFLCLDAVDPADIDYYLNSREDRTYYLYYIDLFMEAKKLLERSAVYEREFADVCSKAVVAGQVTSDVAAMEPAIKNAIRNWRASNRGAALPRPDDKAYQECFEAIINSLYITFGAGQRDRAAYVEELLQQEGRTPLRLVVTGVSKITVYATLLPEEQDTRLGYSPWVQAINVEEKKTKMSLGSRKIVLLPKFSVSETVIKEWEETAAYAGKAAPHGFSYQESTKFLQQFGKAPELVSDWFSTNDDDKFECLLEQAIESIDNASKHKSVNRTEIHIPLMLIRFRHADDLERCTEDPTRTPKFVHHAIFWCADSLEALYIHATAKQKKRIEEELLDTYKNPKTHIAKLREVAESPCEVGRVFSIEVNQDAKKIDFCGLNGHDFRGVRPKFAVPFDFAKPGDRATIGFRNSYSYTFPRTFEVVEAVPVPQTISTILQDKTKSEDDERGWEGREFEVSAGVLQKTG